MRVIFDLKHPADVHFFKDAIAALAAEGSEVLVTSREKDETLELLEGLGIPHTCLSRMGRGLSGMGLELAARTSRMLRLARRFRPDAMVARTGIVVSAVGRALGVPSIVFEDTEFAWLQIALSAPLATVVCTGLGYERRFPGKELRFNAPPQLAYTHPARFRPDPHALRAWGVEPDEPYLVVRIKAWRAAHDVGLIGPEDAELVHMVRALEDHGRPLLSSERELPEALSPLRNPVPAERALDLLAFAQLYVGEGSCMAAEAACLGTPAIYISPSPRRGYLDAMQRRYGHVTTVRTAEEAVRQAELWLGDPAFPGWVEEGRRRLLAECDDPQEFILSTVRAYARGERPHRRAPRC
ncbi:MAG: DUF354 domain-containing protein [Planctomycetota bacterium]|jgi:predicted glycosyltransferase